MNFVKNKSLKPRETLYSKVSLFLHIFLLLLSSLLVFIYINSVNLVDMYRLETILFSNGERFSLLVNEKTGIPDFYSTLWVTVELRNQSAVNTIRNKLGTIQWLMNWEKENNLVISDLIHKEILLTGNQLESLIQHMRLNVKKQKKCN